MKAQACVLRNPADSRPSVTPSPSTETDSGLAILAKNPNSPGSLGIAISEAVEVAANDPDTKYALGSVLNHVLLHQTVIGLEAIEQMALAGDEPDVIVGCTGGGSRRASLMRVSQETPRQGAWRGSIGRSPTSPIW